MAGNHAWLGGRGFMNDRGGMQDAQHHTVDKRVLHIYRNADWFK